MQTPCKSKFCTNIPLKGQWLKNPRPATGFWQYEAEQVKMQKLHNHKQKEKPDKLLSLKLMAAY